MKRIQLIVFSLPFWMTLAYSQTGTVSDVDGHEYKTVRIGNQIWMAENLKTSRYRDGSLIEWVTDNTTWRNRTSGAWCWYSNDRAFEIAYGKLYNWYAISRGNLCPSGWHVPSDSDINNNSEWSTLITRLGGSDIAGGKMKERGTHHWLLPNVGATNRSGFNGLPGGSRGADGTFDGVRFEGFWWNTMERDVWGFSWSRSRILFYNSERIDYFDGDKRMGLSIRCIKD